MSALVREEALGKQQAGGPLAYAPRWARLQPSASGAGVEDETPAPPRSSTGHPGTVHPGAHHPGGRDSGAPDPPWRRKKAWAPFEGDVAIMELRARLALAPDQIPEPPPLRSCGAAWAVVGRFACIVAMAAGGALGLLWLTVPQREPPERQAAHLAYKQPASSEQPVANLKTDFEGAPRATPPVDLLAWPAAGNGEPGRALTAGASTVTDAMASVGPARVLPRAKETRAAEMGPSETRIASPASPSSAAPMPDRDGIAALVARGREYIAAGDVAAARLVLRRAAVAGDPRVALALGGTYDPIVLKELGVIGFAGDPAQARDWYRRAAELGSADAPQRLEQLARLDR